MNDLEDKNSAENKPSEDDTPESFDEQLKKNRRSKPILTQTRYQSVIDQQFQEAVEEGKFDNLRGKGKPLDLETNPYAGDQEMAFKLLKDNNYTLPWIADRNRIMERMEKFGEKLKRQWLHQGPQLKAMVRAEQRGLARRRWLALMAQWQSDIEEINKRVDEVNVSLPVKSLEIIKLNIDVELIRIGADRTQFE